MSKTLFIVEGKGEVEPLQKILGPKYIIFPTLGIFMDLIPKPKKGIGIDIENNFEPDYVITKKEIADKLKDLYKKHKDIIFSSDPDRAGEFISWSAVKLLKIENPKRVTYVAITKDNVEKALKEPRGIDMNLLHAQQALRVLDRIVGYRLSPLLWKNVRANLTAGRVQSVVTRMVYDKELEIKDFLDKGAESYYKVNGSFFIDKKNTVDSTLYKIDDEKKSRKAEILKGSVAHLSENDGTDMPKDVIDFLKKCYNSKITIHSITSKPASKAPPPPFKTTTMQQEASKKLGFNVKRTMMAGQKLYEAGLTSYMRTDSIIMPKDIHDKLKEAIESKYGDNYYKQRSVKDKATNVQAGHAAIYITDVKLEVASGPTIDDDAKRLYSLIWRRTVASQMVSAEYNKTTMQIIGSKIPEYYFETVFEKLIFPGFLRVYNIQDIQKDEEDENGEKTLSEDVKLPAVGSTLEMNEILAKQDYTRPPTRYNEGTLTGQMEKLGIGRPATISAMINKVKEQYVETRDFPGIDKEAFMFSIKKENGEKGKIKRDKKTITLGKEANKLTTTEIGNTVTKYLLENFPEIMDYKFTAQMEVKLDQIAEGKLVWHKVVKNFYDKFNAMVEKLSVEGKKVGSELTKVLGTDPKTEKDVVVEMRTYGPVVRLGTNMAPIKKPLDPKTITLEQALELLRFPINLGKYKGQKVELKRGQYGFYLAWGNKKIHVENENMTFEIAEKIIKESEKDILKEFEDEKRYYTIRKGEYGNYIRVDNKTKAKKNQKSMFVNLGEAVIEDLTLEKVQELVLAYMKKPKFKKFAKKKDGAGDSGEPAEKKGGFKKTFKRKTANPNRKFKFSKKK